MLVMDKVKPSGSSIFKRVESFGSVAPFSVRAMYGCATPERISSCFCDSPASCRAFVRAERRLCLYFSTLSGAAHAKKFVRKKR